MNHRPHRQQAPQAPITEEESARIRLPRAADREMFGLAIQLMGANHIKVACIDGVERICRIPGRLKKKIWIRENDIVLVQLWDFQPSKADIIWRYFGNQSEWLKRKGHLQGLPI